MNSSNPLCGMWYRRITELEAANSDIEGTPQDDTDTGRTDEIRDFRRVEILHLPSPATNDMEQGVHVNRCKGPVCTNTRIEPRLLTIW